MEHVLYRKYRPRSFKETLGQEHVTKTLQQALKAGRISHAYLFTGPRGVGKTSVARILAYKVNDLAYEADTNHLDIIEIDAASNRRIDEIRELRDKVRITPATAKYKVYIIDEVHMLTREAFNALLKTLEEPPAHTIFILATTEAHKLPETIISRTQRFEFKPVTAIKVAEHLKNIARNENIAISPEALNLLAEFGAGSFRDSIGYLDQLSSSGKEVTEGDVREVLGLPSQAGVQLIVDALQAGDAKAAMRALGEIREQGVGAAETAAALSKKLRDQLVNGGGGPIPDLLKHLIDVKASLQPYEYLEIVLLESISKDPNRITSVPAKTLVNPQLKSSPNTLRTDSKKAVQKNIKLSSDGSIDLSLWPKIVEMSRSRAASLYTALRLARPTANGSNLILAFQFPLHKKKVELAKHKALISELFEELSGQKIMLTCVVDKKFVPEKMAKPSASSILQADSSLNSISKVFGTAEMLEA